MSEDEADIFNDDIIDLGGTHSDADGDEGAEEDAPAGGGVAEGGETHDEMDPTFGEINVLLEDDATDIFNEADEELVLAEEVELTERERLTFSYAIILGPPST